MVFEALHTPLALPRQPMRVLAPVIEIVALAVLHAREDLALRGTVAFELIGNDHSGDVQQALEGFAKELLCRLLVASPLYEDVQDVVVLIHHAPEVMALTVNGQKHFIQVPFIPRLRADEDGDGLCEVHVNTMEGFWSLLRSWLRLHRGISQEKLPVYLGFFEFVHNVRKRGKVLLPALIELLVT